MRSPYEILGLTPNASPDEVKAAYRRLAKLHHPDLNRSDPGAAERFRDISAAYEALNRPPENDFGGFAFHGATDLHRQMFEQMMHRMRDHEAHMQNADLQTVVEITLEQAFSGLQTQVTVDHSGQQTHMIDIPRGIQSGQRIRISGAGLFRNPAYPAGHLFVVVQVRPHDSFARAGNDLLRQIEVNSLAAMVGTKEVVNGLDGEVIRVDIPAGIQFGARIRIAHKGMTQLNSMERGHLIVEVLIRTPNLAEIDHNLVDQFLKLLPNRNSDL